MNSKWIIDLKGKPKIIELIEKVSEENLCDIEMEKEFLNITPKATDRKEQLEELSFIKI